MIRETAMKPGQPAATSGMRGSRTRERPIEIEVANRQRHLKVRPARLRQLVRHVLESEAVERAGMSLAIVDDQAMQELHRRFLNVDCPTDVLSFLLSDEGGPLEGEVVVNAQQALRVADRMGGAAEEELLLYVVHGTLHLCGYDDRTRADAAVMRQRQAALLAHWDIFPACEPNERPRGHDSAADGAGDK